MDIPYFGGDVPQFRIPSQPELEKAMNILSESINLTRESIPSFSGSGENVRLNKSGSNVTFSTDNPSNLSKSFPFKVWYAEELSRLYISEGLVQFIYSSEIKSVPPTIRGHKIGGWWNSYWDSDLCSDDPNGVFFTKADLFPVTEVYVKIDGEDCSIYLHDVQNEGKAVDKYKNSALFLIAKVTTYANSVEIEQLWQSDIYLTPVDCPFRISDSSDGSKLAVTIQSNKVVINNGVDVDRYPYGMVQNLKYQFEIPVGIKWLAVYIRFKFSVDSMQVLDEDTAVQFVFSDYFKVNTDTEQYELIGMITVSYDSKGQRYISDIMNVCWAPYADKTKLVQYCPFSVSDVSVKKEGGQLENRIKVQNGYVAGISPNGMVENRDYVIVVPSSVLEVDKFYVYLKVIVDETNSIAKYSTAVTIEVTKFPHESGSFIQWTLLADVYLGTDSNGGKFISSIVNKCPSPYINLIKGCPFEVEDATDGQEVKIQVALTKVSGKYPVGMEEGLPYQIVLPSDSNWYAVYAVVLLNSEGTGISSHENAITVGIYDSYQKSELNVQYTLIATVNIDTRDPREDSSESRYISYIRNYCNDVVVDYKSCPFSLYDASDYETDQNGNYYPINAKVQVLKTSIDGRYPYGMNSSSPFVLQITEEDISLNGVTPSNGKCYVYVQILVDEYGNVYDYDTAITIEKSSRWYNDGGVCTQRYLIGTVNTYYNEKGQLALSSVQSMCPEIRVAREANCPFQVEDASEGSNLKVQIRTGKLGDDNNGNEKRYPEGMYEYGRYILDLEKSSKNIIYCASVINSEGYLVDGFDGSNTISFLVAYDFLSNENNIQYDLIAIVETNEFEITSIQNTCYEPRYKQKEPCSFSLYDASTYSEQNGVWAAQNCVVQIQPSLISGRYPYGMAQGVKYLLPFSDSDFSANTGTQRCYVYLKVLVNDDGDIYSYSTAITIEKSPYYYENTDHFTCQRILIGWVDADFSSGKATMADYGVYSECPSLTLNRSQDCLFKIEDYSDLTKDGNSAIIIRNGKINGRYPSGMSKNTIYSLDVNSYGTNYVYAVIVIDSKGDAISGMDGDSSISFQISNKYLSNTSSVYYASLGTVTKDSDGQLYIQSYCIDPSIPKKQSACFFNVTDASVYAQGSNIPSLLRVRISNSKVNEAYPSGMSDLSDYVLTIDPNTDVDSAGVCRLYVLAILDEDGTLSDGANSLTIEKTKYYRPKGNYIQHIPIANVELAKVVGGNGAYAISKIANFCPDGSLYEIPSCPFYVDDASDSANLKVQIRTGKIGDSNNGNDKRYPKGMSKGTKYQLTLDKTKDTQIVYCASVISSDGYLVDGVDGDDSISFFVADDYISNDANVQYDIIAVVSIVTDGHQNRVISVITNSCSEPAYKQKEVCSFSLYDASTYRSDSKNNWEALDCKVLVSNSTIQGRYPIGMSGSTKYVLSFTSNDFIEGEDFGRCYLYLKVLVNDDGDIYDYDSAISIQKSPYYSNTDNFTYQRILIGWVDADLRDGVKMTQYGVHSECPPLILNKPSDCLFKVEDSSDLERNGKTSVVIRNGKINDRYPHGMSRNTIYSLDVNSYGTNYVYAVISIDADGNALEGTDGDTSISFEVVNFPRNNTVSTYYAVIALVEKNENDGQLYIQSYCIDPSIPNKELVGCAFKTIDVSPYPTGSNIPSYLMVQIANSKIMGGYPTGMYANGQFRLILDPTRDFDSEGICYIYGKIILDEYLRVKQFTIEKRNRYHTRGSYIQWIPISKVYISNVVGTASKEISKIANFCPSDSLDTPQACPFYVEVADDNSVHVLSTKIEGAYPVGMGPSANFIRQVPYTWSAVYSKILLKNGAVDWTDQNYITIVVLNEYKKSTSTVQYDLLAEVYSEYLPNGSFSIVSVANKCVQPVVNTQYKDCPFEVTDASEYFGGIPVTCKVRIKNTKIFGIYPSGMYEGTDYDILIDESKISSDGYLYLYVTLYVDAKGYVLGGPNSVVIEDSRRPLETDGISIVRYPIAVCRTYKYLGAFLAILEIKNLCPVLEGKINSQSCPFRVEDASDDSGLKVQVHANLIEGYIYPLGMSDNVRYILEINDTEGAWHGIYCGYNVDQYGNILDGSADVWIESLSTRPSNTAYTKYLLLADVYSGYDDRGHKEINFIQNYCRTPIPGGGGGSTECPFRLTDSSEGDNWKFKIAYGLIGGVQPIGMNLADDPPLIMSWVDGYVCAVVSFNEGQVTVSEVYFEIFPTIPARTSTLAYYPVGCLRTVGQKKVILSLCSAITPSVCDLLYSDNNSGGGGTNGGTGG